MFRGMGGNQAMRDTATLLPILLSLNDQLSSEKRLSKQSIDLACEKYENEMIPRAFSWVQKSGGGSLLVSNSSFSVIPTA